MPLPVVGKTSAGASVPSSVDLPSRVVHLRCFSGRSGRACDSRLRESADDGGLEVLAEQHPAPAGGLLGRGGVPDQGVTALTASRDADGAMPRHRTDIADASSAVDPHEMVGLVVPEVTLLRGSIWPHVLVGVKLPVADHVLVVRGAVWGHQRRVLVGLWRWLARRRQPARGSATPQAWCAAWARWGRPG